MFPIIFNKLKQMHNAAAAAAAKSLQSCPTLYDPIDGSPPGSPVPEILQAKTFEWVAISFSNAWKWPTPGVHPDSHPWSRWCHPAISSSRPLLLLPPIPLSTRVFSNESTLHMKCPKYWSFSFSIIPSTEIPGLISFRMAKLNKQNSKCILYDSIYMTFSKRQYRQKKSYQWLPGVGNEESGLTTKKNKGTISRMVGCGIGDKICTCQKSQNYITK